MPLTFPTLTGGYVAKYPLKRSHKHRTAVLTFSDFSEQRWCKAGQLEEFELHFSEVGTTDKEAFRAFFTSVQGRLDTTWSITIPDPPGSTTTFNYCQFLDSTFEVTSKAEGYWSFILRIRQTRPN